MPSLTQATTSAAEGSDTISLLAVGLAGAALVLNVGFGLFQLYFQRRASVNQVRIDKEHDRIDAIVSNMSKLMEAVRSPEPETTMVNHAVRDLRNSAHELLRYETLYEALDGFLKKVGSLQQAKKNRKSVAKSETQVAEAFRGFCQKFQQLHKDEYRIKRRNA